MNIATRIEKLLASIANKSATSAGSAPDAVAVALDRCLDESRGEDFHEALFAIARACAHAREAGREIDLELIFVEAGVCGPRRAEIEAFVSMDPDQQCAYLDGLR